TSEQASMFGDWVNGGGHLIAMRPDKQLASLLGLSATESTLAEGYVQVNSAAPPGVGITARAMQFHGVADVYNTDGARAVAMLYGNAKTATTNPAVTTHSVGRHGGQASAFTYDLATSVVYTRQGNPAWSGQERDEWKPIRSDDLFYGKAKADPKPDW